MFIGPISSVTGVPDRSVDAAEATAEFEEHQFDVPAIQAVARAAAPAPVGSEKSPPRRALAKRAGPDPVPPGSRLIDEHGDIDVVVGDDGVSETPNLIHVIDTQNDGAHK